MSHQFLFFPRTVAATLALLSANFVFAQKPVECAPLDPGARSRVVHLVARKLGTDPVLPRVEEEKIVSGTCYREFVFSVPDTKRRWSVYLSPDFHFLSAGLWDVSVDVVTADGRVAAQLLQEATSDNPPTLGPSSAPVTVVEFADFQCPYCARLSKMIEVYRKENPDKVRLIFRHFPLSIHNWATPAARAGSCIARQNKNSFWQFHDLLFSQQKAVTQENLPGFIGDFFSKAPELNGDEFRQCINSPLAESSIERDLTEGHNYRVVSTPTIFINGRQYGTFRNDSALRAAIDAAVPAKAVP
jgi:protein-disulfide isomerase